MQVTTDLELLQKCTTGDADAFAVIVRRHQNLVCSVAYSVLGNFAASEDVGQDTLVAAWQQLPQSEDLTTFRAWVSSIARNKALTVLRQQRNSQSLSDDVVSTAEEPDGIAINHEEETLVWQALQGLPENYREPMVLFYRNECSVAEVANSLDLSEDAVKQRLHRGREMLRTEVAEIVERTLRSTVPTTAFTVAVMCSVGLGASTASAAVGTAGKMSAPIVVAAAVKTGIAAGIFGAVAGFAGACLGPWMAMKNARYESERQLIKTTSIRVLWVLGLTCLPSAMMLLGWRPWEYGAPVFFGRLFILIIVQMVCILGIALQAQRKLKDLLAKEVLANAPQLPQTKLKKWVGQWEGRDFTSKATFLGLPLLQIKTQSMPNHWQMKAPAERSATVARGWIAIGDKAYGVLLAMGGRAVGGIAFGGMSAGIVAFGGVSFGLISVGGLALGGLVIGGCSLGVASYGGLAIGWLAFGGGGGGALAWKCAVGGAEIAHEMAVGGYASAAEANSEIAKQFVLSNSFFQTAQQAAESKSFSLSLQLGWFLPLMLLFAVSFRRKSAGEEDPPA